MANDFFNPFGGVRIQSFVNSREAIPNCASGCDFFEGTSIFPPGFDTSVTDLDVFAKFTPSGIPPTGVPEPTTLTLFAAGLLGLGFVMWRRRRVR